MANSPAYDVVGSCGAEPALYAWSWCIWKDLSFCNSHPASNFWLDADHLLLICQSIWTFVVCCHWIDWLQQWTPWLLVQIQYQTLEIGHLVFHQERFSSCWVLSVVYLVWHGILTSFRRKQPHHLWLMNGATNVREYSLKDTKQEEPTSETLQLNYLACILIL